MIKKSNLDEDALVKAIFDAIRADSARLATKVIPKQTFDFEHCVDLIWKLYWEIVRLQEATPHNPIDMKCFAFNAAVTAWQLTDWVFEDMTPSQRAQHKVVSLGDFQNLVRQQCRPLHLCRQIATASKHRIVTKHPDPGVSASVVVVPSAPGQLGSFEIVINDGGTTHPALDILEEARLYWYKFIDNLGLID
jgi:hypothetical protein